MVRNETYMKQLGKMERPIAGMSLTNDPNNPAPYEGPPEFTKKEDALNAIFMNMTQEEKYVPMMQALIEGTPIMEMTQILLFEGFRQGKWNPDLFMMLVEPTAYVIMALAERAEVDYEIDREGDDVDPQSDIESKFNMIGNKLGKGKVLPGIIPADIEEKIEQLAPAESLVSRPSVEEPEVMAEPEVMEDSLINKRV
jgi:hypothetical protein